MWFDGIRQPNTLYVASVSRGKDSTAMLRAIQIMGWPLDAICSVDVWATQDIPAELPPMVRFKDEWDKKCLEHLGIPVTRLCATKRSKVEREPESDGECHSRRMSYEDMFYRKLESGKFIGNIKGFPNTTAAWCRHLKMDEVDLRGYFLQTDKSEKGCESGGGVLGIPEQTDPAVQQRTQTQTYHGFQYRQVFQSAPERGAENKYRSLHRHCR